MSQENVELAYRAYDAFNRRDWDALLTLMDTRDEHVHPGGLLALHLQRGTRTS